MKKVMVAMFLVLIAGFMLLSLRPAEADEVVVIPEATYTAACWDIDLCEEHIQSECFVGETGSITAYHKGSECSGKCCRQSGSGSWSCYSILSLRCS